MNEQNENSWYYVQDLETIGPESDEEIHELINNGTIKETTLLWNGSGEWHAAAESCFSQYFMKEEQQPEPDTEENENKPPVLPASLIKDGPVYWYFALLLLMTIVDAIIKAEVDGNGIPMYVYMLPIVFLNYDANRIKKTGRSISAFWAYFLTPVYLFKRARCLGRGLVHFWVSIGLIVFMVVGGLLLTVDPVIATAKQAVNQIIQENYSPSTVTCTAISVQKKLSDSISLATATLSDGTEWQITIREDKDQVWVTVVE